MNGTVAVHKKGAKIRLNKAVILLQEYGIILSHEIPRLLK